MCTPQAHLDRKLNFSIVYFHVFVVFSFLAEVDVCFEEGVAFSTVLDVLCGVAFALIEFGLKVGLTMCDGTEGVACFTAGWCLVDCTVFVLSLNDLIEDIQD